MRTLPHPALAVALALPLAAAAAAGGATVAPGAPAAPGAADRTLPYSRASNTVVQRQPPAGSCHAIGSGRFTRPDPRCTPGALNPQVTQASIRRTICVRGWTSSVRPPERITEREKRASMSAYGDTGSVRHYEYDHLVPLELGGATNDARNLWPEPGATPNPKDGVENTLRRRVCAGTLSLARARSEIATDWVAVYRTLRAGRDSP
jgi:hypothetical protein